MAWLTGNADSAIGINMQQAQLVAMDYQEVKIKMKTKHIELLESLKQEYGCQTRARALEMLLDDLLDPDPASLTE